MKLFSKLYFVTWVTIKGEINSGHYGHTQQEGEQNDHFMNLSEGMIVKSLFETINNCTNNNCRAIVNFWFIKCEVIEV